MIFGSTEARDATRVPRARGEAPRPWAPLPLSLRDVRTTNGSKSQRDGPNLSEALFGTVRVVAIAREPGYVMMCAVKTSTGDSAEPIYVSPEAIRQMMTEDDGIRRQDRVRHSVE
jgi:hypothetical protein